MLQSNCGFRIEGKACVSIVYNNRTTGNQFFWMNLSSLYFLKAGLPLEVWSTVILRQDMRIIVPSTFLSGSETNQYISNLQPSFVLRK